MNAPMKRPDLRVENVPTNVLLPFAQNSRTHSDDQVEQIIASIREFGWTNPILIDEKGGIIAGHGRVMAAKKMKLISVPAIQLKGLTEAQKRAYVIADNKLALNAGWDNDILASELEYLQTEGFDVALTGFTENEINRLQGDRDSGSGTGSGEGGEEAETRPTCKPGELWQLGVHRLTIGKALPDLDQGDEVIRRWETFTGLDAVHDKTGMTFAERADEAAKKGF